MNDERPGEGPDDATGRAADGVSGEERARALMDELRRLRVQDLALDMAVSLVTVGYQKLGLTEQTRDLRDLGEARLSIELLRACLDVLERERPAVPLGDLRGTLSAMQLNFARAVDEERAAAGAGEAAEAPPADAANEAQTAGATQEPNDAGTPPAGAAAKKPRPRGTKRSRPAASGRGAGGATKKKGDGSSG